MALLDDKTAIVTGGAGSIGLATARLFLDEGANIVLVDKDRVGLERAAAGLPRERVALAAADVTDSLSTKAYVDLAVERFGGIDVLFSNAGTFGTVAPIADYSLDVFDAVQAVHVRGAFLAAKHAVPHIRAGGSIVITSSVAATRGDPGVYAYITAKHAQTGLMRCLAKELAPRGIRVNTVNPGPVDNGFQLAVEQGFGAATGMDGTDFFNTLIPMGRHASAGEIARSVLYLASDQSSFVTGTMLMVDGGMST
ncbi:SDR family NAD(P)-dependent oxidoreductase [Shinella sp. S4-D37]|uniref:SDR family NAD(P)-dependent oxidoreductase n=1 Tax=Shinella sp. S4-D37 TaxID=3161999 RepID=UPI0034650497